MFTEPTIENRFRCLIAKITPRPFSIGHRIPLHLVRGSSPQSRLNGAIEVYLCKQTSYINLVSIRPLSPKLIFLICREIFSVFLGNRRRPNNIKQGERIHREFTFRSYINLIIKPFFGSFTHSDDFCESLTNKFHPPKTFSTSVTRLAPSDK